MIPGRRALHAALLLLASLSAAGCRAQVSVTTEDGGDAGAPLDSSVDADLGDLAPPPPDLACSGPVAPEICNNGCDDDRNGYTDADDPACTTQLLVTFQAGSPVLNRMILEPQPHLVPLDGNPVPAQSFAAHHRAFSPAAYLTVEGGSKQLRRIALGDGGYSDTFVPYSVRGACTFNGELVVVERSAASQLHRFMADGKTEIGVVPLLVGGMNVLATSCASDGNLLYVAVHDPVGNPSQFLVFDKQYLQVGAPLAVPASLAAAGYVHVLSIGWTEKQGVFYGLFTANLSPNDATLNGSQLVPFSFDGAAGAPLDAGVLHGLGEFVP